MEHTETPLLVRRLHIRLVYYIAGLHANALHEL